MGSPELTCKPPVGWGFIYYIVSPSGKGYVGQTICRLGTRIAQHKRIDKHGGISSAFTKYGERMQARILECCRREFIDQAEREHIARLGTRAPAGYNLTDGGHFKPLITPQRGPFSVAASEKRQLNMRFKSAAFFRELKASIRASGLTSQAFLSMILRLGLAEFIKQKGTK
jgi:hypothetical protein